MEAKYTKAKQSFVPVDVTLTFQSQEELDAMGSLFNSTQFTDVMGEVIETLKNESDSQTNEMSELLDGLDGRLDEVWSVFEKAGANINRTPLVDKTFVEVYGDR